MKRAAVFQRYRQEWVDFSGLSAADKILIGTDGYEYRFLVLNPARRSGLLWGGLAGPTPRQAVMVGTLNSAADYGSDASGLKVGGQALFYVSAESGVGRLVTAPVTRLAHIRRRSSRPAA